MLREKMNEHGLTDWSVRLNQNMDSRYLGLCSYKDKCIILSAHHIDIHPSPDVTNTILHEIAHALVGPGHAHNQVWQEKAKSIGCDNTLPCSNLSLSPDVIDAIRSGADVEVTFDEHVVRTPKYKITRLQDKCEVCDKVAVTKSEKFIETGDKKKHNLKLITLECGHVMMRKIPKGTPFHLFQMGGSEDCVHTWEKNSCTSCGRFRPYQFQLEGMAFLETALSTNSGAACFDEMGLGKTIQAGGVIFFNRAALTPTLWVVKAGTKYQTASFILHWMPGHFPQVINTSKDVLVRGYTHYIIGYDMLVHKSRTLKNGTVVNSGFDIKKFDDIGIKCVVLDECQQIKNVDSSRTQMVRQVVKGRKVLPLSGTPWNNRGTELFPVLNMIAPMKFPSEAKFERDWVEHYWDGNRYKVGGIARHRIAAFKEYIKDICIRRERAAVMPELPKTNRQKCVVHMDLVQEKVYDEAVDEFVKWYESQAENLQGIAIIAAMQKMRQLVAITKIPATLEYIDEFVEETDRKLVIFAHHIAAQQLIHDDVFEKYSKQFPVMQITADMTPLQRWEVQEKFNSSKRAIIVASMLAAGEGLNLQTCSDCVMHERQWNPGKEEQCEDRFARIGQEANSVNAVYMHMEGLTVIDAQLDTMVEQKRIRFHSVHNTGEVQAWNEHELMKELAASIVRAHKMKRAS
jgi:hypothetical protein